MLKHRNFTKLILLLAILALLFTRMFNLDRTARFIWDESSDLVRMHQFYVEKTLTLVGPISEDGSKVFGSLTYYMLMPFAVLGNFDPVSPAYGAAFWGIITSLLLIRLLYNLNSRLILLAILLAILWYPLVETSRWAWNPNLIPYWSTLGLLLYFHNKKWSIFLSGLALGLTTHHHYLAVFSLAAFSLVVLIQKLVSKQYKEIFLFAAGITLTILPFVIFDLKHPPGLFLSRILYFNHVESSTSVLDIFSKFFSWYQTMTLYYTQSNLGSILLMILIPILLLLDFIKRHRSFAFSFVWLIQLACLTFIYNPGDTPYYILPSTIFFAVWLFSKRSQLSHHLSLLIILIVIISSSFALIPKISTTHWRTDIYSTREITNIIAQTIEERDLKNSNIAVLASPDNNTYGRRFRDLLLLKEINLKSRHEYDITDHLFVITTADEDTLRRDNAYEMHNFRKGPLLNTQRIKNSPWKVYHFTK